MNETISQRAIAAREAREPQPVEIQCVGLVPANISEAMQLANMMATAKLVPAALQKSPADCLMVIQQAVRWQMDPFAVAQECSVIQGKLMHSGKLVAAVVNARGNLAQRLAFAYEGEGVDRQILVSGRLQGETALRSVTVKWKDARTQNQMWVKQPDQQLMYHGCRVWARRHTPELMLGVYSPEEMDGIDVTSVGPAAGEPVTGQMKVVSSGKVDYPTPQAAVETQEKSAAAAPPADEPSAGGDGFPDLDELPDSEAEEAMEDALVQAAGEGEDALRKLYQSMSPEQREKYLPDIKKKWLPHARSSG